VQHPVVTFVLDDGQIFGCNFFHLISAHYFPDKQSVLLRFPSGIAEIIGPKALDFYKDFAKHKASWIKADGEGIVSVTLVEGIRELRPG
jgi:hypothetical protein